MQILDWAKLSEAERRAALQRPALAACAEILSTAREVIARVRAEGDAAVRAFTKRFDGLDVESFMVSTAEFKQANTALTAAQYAALERAIENIYRFHLAQLPKSLTIDTMPGVRCERLIRPLSSVGLYVPSGTAPLPSTVLMLAIPARIAGCRERILCAPPNREGQVSPAVLVAARLCGIETVYKVGGAQAIAAMAYRTETIPKVDKIFGPGNAWVTAAKQLVAQDPEGAACDLPAGPSEVMVLADETARVDFVATDLLAQAEHDTHAQAILVTTSPILAQIVAAELACQTRELNRQAILSKSLEGSRCILAPNSDAALSIVNRYAPEHLIVHLENARSWLPQIQNAGSVFLGPWSPETLGDYCAGVNHVLPTYGHARTHSALSVSDFTKSISVQEITPNGLRTLGPIAVELAELEGLDAHARAVTRRLNALNPGTDQ